MTQLDRETHQTWRGSPSHASQLFIRQGHAGPSKPPYGLINALDMGNADIVRLFGADSSGR